ncbi:MAG: hypothetical protein R3E56_05555 [Burkholderiaceae bacterium]
MTDPTRSVQLDLHTLKGGLGVGGRQIAAPVGALLPLPLPSVRVKNTDLSFGIRIFNKLLQMRPHSIERLDDNLDRTEVGLFANLRHVPMLQLAAPAAVDLLPMIAKGNQTAVSRVARENEP